MKFRLTPTLALIVASGATASAFAQQERSPDAGMIRYPDVSKDHIVFVYANDLWVVDRDGGQAVPLASPDGQEMFPRFSPDGSMIVFQGNYEGDRDLYTVPVLGGVPERVTHHPATEFPTDWSDEHGIVFHKSGTAGLTRQQQIYAVPPEGGLPEKLPPAYGANASISADGNWLAYTPQQRDFRTWKRYAGGLASDIWIMNLETLESEQITDHVGTDTLPMWHRDTVYYLSDAGPEHKLNIWSYDVRNGQREQVTDFDEWDCKFPAIGPGDGDGEIVLQNGPDIYLVNLRTGRTRPVEITVPGAKPTIRTNTVDAAEFIQSGGISATGKRVAVEARGDIWTLPAETGAPRQLTTSDGAAERNPAWSPDGRWIAYFSDEDGEYNLYVTQSDGKGETRKLTDTKENYFFQIAWAPNSESLLVTDKTGAIHHVDLESGDRKTIDRDEWANQPSLSWSGDSRWIAYSVADPDSGVSVIKIHDTDSGETRQVTSGFFSDSEPVFARTGEYLYYASSREFTSPQYDDLGTTFVYSDTERLIAVPLNSEVENPALIEPDEETWDEDEETDEENGDAEEAENGEDEDAADGEDADADVSPLVGTWSATAKGLAALGLPTDELEYTMYFKQLEDGSFIGASEQQGETSNYDSVEFDEDTGEVVLRSSQGPISSTTRATINGDKMTGTWEIAGAMQGSGAMEAEKTSEDVPDDKIDEKSGGASDDPVEIEFEGFEARGVQLNAAAGGFSNLLSNNSGAIMYNRSGGNGSPPSVRMIDAADEEPEEKTIVTGAVLYDVSGDGKKILLAGQGNRWKIADAKPGQSMADAIQPSGLLKHIDPREEWRQLFTDAWRRHRDFFYVENMHGVDWDAVYDRYSSMLDDATTREDVSFIIGEMIAELNVGHAYYWGGDVDDEPSTNVGLLGADFELASEEDENGDTHTAYKITKLYGGAPWDTDARNPLDLHGVDVSDGVYITHVNGAPIDTSKDPWAAFIGTAGKETTITFADALTGDEETRNVRDVTITPSGNEVGLRYRDWVESNREYVEEQSNGRIGYIYVPNTGVQGQNELFRQFYGQMGKDALLIDERWNGGGQIPTRFIELLNRPRTNYWYRRDGKDWGWPPDSHQGPKAMLINGAAGSGGDMFPWLFKHNGIGKLIGQRTWGGLVGISGVPPLIDGGYTAVPNFGFYETDGTWGIEGYGVEPDIEVVDDPTELAKGGDPQLDAAIEHLLQELETGAYDPPQRPSPPDRSGFGITEQDK